PEPSSFLFMSMHPKLSHASRNAASKAASAAGAVEHLASFTHRSVSRYGTPSQLKEVKFSRRRAAHNEPARAREKAAFAGLFPSPASLPAVNIRLAAPGGAAYVAPASSAGRDRNI